MSTQTSDTLGGAPTSIQAQRPFVLVAEDSADMRGLLVEILESEGCEVLGVASGGRALTEMTHRRPDLVITDLFMPGMTGFTLRSLMLRRPDLARVPVIVLSAYWHRPSETLEVADVLTKPLNIDRLIGSVRRLLSHPATAAASNGTTDAVAVAMSDQPIREPIPPDPERDRTESTDGDTRDDRSPLRPSAAEGDEEDAGQRPPRPSQAEGELDTTKE